jgi:hypothetical protein
MILIVMCFTFESTNHIRLLLSPKMNNCCIRYQPLQSLIALFVTKYNVFNQISSYNIKNCVLKTQSIKYSQQLQQDRTQCTIK